jgi:hypothetical protein
MSRWPEITVFAATLLTANFPTAARATTDCFAVDKLGWYVPDHARLQTGGYLGMLTVGVGYSAFDALDVDVYYGWVPEPVGGRDIHSVALRLGTHVRGLCVTRDVRWIFLSAGIGGVTTFGERFFLVSPEPFPSSYYQETMVRSFLSIGTELAFRVREASLIAGHSAFIEVTALDEYVLVWLKNVRTRSAWDPWSLTIGYKLRI